MKPSSNRIDELISKYLDYKNTDNSIEYFVNQNDIEDLKYVLRVIKHLFVEIQSNKFIIHKVFPIEFITIREINRENHPWFKEFIIKKGTKMYLSKSRYSSCDFMNGIPLWINKDVIEGTYLTPSVQVNYDYIKPIL